MIPEVSALGSLPQQPRPAPDVAEAITAAELMRRDLPASSWLLDGMLPQGVTLLAGRPKAGKSWLALQIALTVATGITLPGGPTAVAGSGLYLALEDTQNRLKGRLQRLLAALGVEAPNGLNLMTSWPRLDQGGREHLGAWLQLHPCVRLLVVDTLAMIRSPGQTSGYENDYRTIDELRALSARFGLAVLVVHHLRKAPARDPFD
jgi:RecA-family ATPase